MLNGRGAAARAAGVREALELQWAELKAEANQIRQSLLELDRIRAQRLRGLATTLLEAESAAAIDRALGTSLAERAMAFSLEIARAPGVRDRIARDPRFLRYLDIRSSGGFDAVVGAMEQERAALLEERRRLDLPELAAWKNLRRIGRDEAFYRLWRFCTLADRREPRLAEHVRRRLGMSPERALARIREIRERIAEIGRGIDRLRREWPKILELARAQKRAEALSEDPDRELGRELSRELAERLSKIDPARFAPHPDARVVEAAAALHELDARRRYLFDLLHAVEGEMRQRQRRLRELDRLVQGCEAAPDDPVGEDDERFVREVEERCRALKDRMLELTRDLHHGLYRFADRDAYLREFRRTAGRFLPYDVFRASMGDACPPDEFASAVLPDVEAARSTPREENP